VTTPAKGAVTNFTVALPEYLKAALFKRAQVDDRSAGSIARKALVAYLCTSPPESESKAEVPQP
jgi:hypothetical protein